jgi:hypothetical protein
VYQDGKVSLTEHPVVTGAVPVIVTFLDRPEPVRGSRKGAVADHPAFGIWAGRDDIQDAAHFARGLRERAERRRDGR